MKTRLSDFDENVMEIFAEAERLETARQIPDVVDEANRRLQAEWKSKGAPLLLRLEEIGRSERFKRAEELVNFDWTRLMAAGVSTERIRMVVDSARSAVVSQQSVLRYLGELRERIIRGVDPNNERPHLHGTARQSIRISTDLNNVSLADRDIEETLDRLELYVADLRRDLHFPAKVLSIDRSPLNDLHESGPSAA